MRLHLTKTALGMGIALGVLGLTAFAAEGCGNDDVQAVPDASRDQTSPEAGPDVGNDTGSDVNSPPDASPDAGDGDATGDALPPPDAGLVPVGDFPAQASIAYCKRLQQCCLSDAGTFQAKCEAALGGYYDIFALGQYINYPDGGVAQRGTILLDPMLAAKCLSDLASLQCGVLPAAGYAKVRSECQLAMVGQIPVATDAAAPDAGDASTADGGDAGLAPPCLVAGECVSGAFCNIPSGAQLGQCLPTEGLGVACGKTNTNRDEQCNYLGLGIPQYYCGPGNQCVMDLGLDAGCTQNWQCQSGLCTYQQGAGTRCSSDTIISDPGTPNGTCAYFSAP